MTKYEKVIEKLKEKGVITTKEAVECGVSATALKYWVDEGKLERVSRGIYSLPNDVVDSMYVMQLKCTKGIFSHETALLMHDFSDRTPSKNVMTVPAGYNTQKYKNEPVEFHWIKKELHELGVIEMESLYGNPIRVYDLERTICDIIKYRKQMDSAIVNNALREYVNHPKAKKFKLAIYAKKMGITNTVNKVMEVLR